MTQGTITVVHLQQAHAGVGTDPTAQLEASTSPLKRISSAEGAMQRDHSSSHGYSSILL